jgi:hypothetical protein
MTIAETLRLGFANLGGQNVFDPKVNKYVPPRLPFPLKEFRVATVETVVRYLHEHGRRAVEQLKLEVPHARRSSIEQG